MYVRRTVQVQHLLPVCLRLGTRLMGGVAPEPVCGIFHHLRRRHRRLHRLHEGSISGRRSITPLQQPLAQPTALSYKLLTQTARAPGRPHTISRWMLGRATAELRELR